MKKVLIGLAIVIGIIGAAFAVLMYMAFGGQTAIEDGKVLPGGAVTVKDGFVAAYILPAGDHAVALVDCGNDPKGLAILAALQKQSLGPEAVKAIFITHAHGDHIAACKSFSQAQTYAFSEDFALAAGQGRSKGPITQFLDTPVDRRITVNHALENAEPVTVGTLTVTPYRCEGHTAGSAAFLANDTLFMGDSMSTRNDGSLKPAVGPASDSTEANHASLVRLGKSLANAGIKAVAPAHSGPAEFEALAEYQP